MSAVQLDLLDLLTEQARPARITGPGHCPACGEPVDDVSGYHAGLNHAFDYDGHPTNVEECTSMRLTRCHVQAALKALACLHQNGPSCPASPGYLCLAHGVGGNGPLTPKQAGKARIHWCDDLNRSWDRAVHVWRNHVPRLAALLAPDLEAAGLTFYDLKEAA